MTPMKVGLDPGSWTRRIPHGRGGSEMIETMARKNYSEEFRRQAVDLYESTPGATLKGIAADLGVVRGTLALWVETLGTGKRTAPDGSTITDPPRPGRRPAGATADAETGPETPEQKVARLTARVRQLEAETAKLTTEREILRQAAKYFAGETRW